MGFPLSKNKLINDFEDIIRDKGEKLNIYRRKFPENKNLHTVIETEIINIKKMRHYLLTGREIDDR